MEKITRFFWFCSGAHIDTLKKYPIEHNKYVGIGATIFFTAFFASLSGGYAMYFVFNGDAFAVGFAILFGLLWGTAIFNMDRYIVSSINKEGTPNQQLLQAQAELASAKAIAALATTTAKRWQALLANDAVSRQEAEEKTGDLTTKQSVVNALQANLDRFQALKRFTRIVAPFDGVVTARSTDVGALINVGGAPGSELFVVSDIRKLRVYVSLPQNYVSAVRQGSKARLTVPENPAKSHAATVQSLSQAISAASGSMLIQLAADNANGELLPGGFANVSFDLPRAAGALSIPPSALIFNKAGLRVGTVGADGKVQLKAVTVARDLGSVIEIATGLSADDRVIESPPDGIAEGDAVRVASAEPKVNAAGKRERGKD